MLCEKCGKELPDGTDNCPDCENLTAVEENEETITVVNEDVPEAENVESAKAENDVTTSGTEQAKKANKTIFMLAGAMIAVVAIIAVIVASMWGGRDDNQMSILMDSWAKMSEAKSADLAVEIAVGEESTGLSFSYLMGETFLDSVIDVAIESDWSNMRVIMCDGYYAIGNTYYGEDLDDPEAYYKIAFEELFYYTDIDFDELIIDSEPDMDELYEQLDEVFGSVFEYMGLYDASVKGVVSVIDDFFRVKCSEKDVTDQFISEVEKTKSNGIVAYKYNIDIRAMLDMFKEYVNPSEFDEKLMEEKGISQDDLEACSLAVSFIRRGMSENDIMAEGIDIIVGVDDKGYLRRMSLSTEIDGDSLSYDISIDNINSSTLDVDGIKALMKQIEEY